MGKPTIRRTAKTRETVCVRLSEEAKKALETLQKKYNTTKSEIVIYAIEMLAWQEEQREKRKKPK